MIEYRIAALAAGWHHSLALTDDGRVIAWGSNSQGQLGDGTTEDRARPAAVYGLNQPATAIAAARFFSMALMADGSVMTWGGSGRPSSHEVLGADDSAAPRSLPGQVNGLQHAATAIATSGEHCLVLTSEGLVLAWGGNGYGQLGDGTTLSRSTPAPVALDGRHVVGIAAGGGNLAITETGEVLEWPRIGSRRSATPSPPGAISLVVEGLRGPVAQVAVCQSRFAVTEDGIVAGWGGNYDGQLGDGTTDSRAIPTAVALPIRVRSVCAGPDHTLAVAADGSVVIWGGAYQANDGDYDDDIPLGGTKLCGRADLPSDAPWPTFRDRPQMFVAQVNLAEVSALMDETPLPRSGLLSFFWSADLWPTGYESDEKGGGAIIYTPSGSDLERRDHPTELSAMSRERATPLRPTMELTLPPVGSLEFEGIELSPEEGEIYHQFMYELDSDREPVHQLLGHFSPAQPGHLQQRICQFASNGFDGPRRYDSKDPLAVELMKGAGEWRLLFQVDSDLSVDLSWGDMGRQYWWITRDDLANRRFDRTWVLHQEH
jgi:uncharacterized protein YwqG